MCISRCATHCGQAGREYHLLGGLRRDHRRLECLHVTLSEYGHSRSVYRLEPGDSLLLDREAARGPLTLVQTPIRFLSVVAFPDQSL